MREWWAGDSQPLEDARDMGGEFNWHEKAHRPSKPPTHAMLTCDKALRNLMRSGRLPWLPCGRHWLYFPYRFLTYGTHCPWRLRSA